MRIYNGKRVFVTGHTGFKGSWLLMMLNYLGADVKGYALEPENETDLFPSIRGEELCDSVIADIRDIDRLKRELISFEPDFLFHLAAQPLVRYSYEFPVDTFSINVMGTVNVLEVLRELKKKCSVVVVTTDKVYENPEHNLPFKESDKLGGHDPYSSSKACAEIVTESYRRSFFNPKDYHLHGKSIASARAGNVIGGGDYAKDRIVPDIIRALTGQKIITVRNPDSIRPWQHVLDPLYGYLQLGASNYQDPVQFSSAYNFGPDFSEQLSVAELVERAIECWGSGEFEMPENMFAPHEAKYLMLDNRKAREDLGWLPQMSASDAIRRTLEWYRNDFLKLSDRRALMRMDIEAYFHD